MKSQGLEKILKFLILFQISGILFGNESSGVPYDVHQLVKNRLKIPMKTNMRSLNIATSVAIILAECLKQTKLI